MYILIIYNLVIKIMSFIITIIYSFLPLENIFSSSHMVNTKQERGI